MSAQHRRTGGGAAAARAPPTVPASEQVQRWAKKCFPEASGDVREKVFRNDIDDEGPSCYALLCAEEGRSCPLPVATPAPEAERRITPPQMPLPSMSIEPSEPGSQTNSLLFGSTRKVEPLDHGPLTAGPAPSAPSPVPPKTLGGTPMTGRTDVESTTMGLGMPGFNPMKLFRDSVASNATLASSAPSPAPKAPLPELLGGGLDLSALGGLTGLPDLKDASQADLEMIAFMQFQSQLEQAMGNEAVRDEGAALALLQQQCEQDLMALAAQQDAPDARVKDILLSREDPSQPPGFELDENMRVVEIMENSPALFAGLMGCIGYRLIEVNGITVQKAEDLRRFWSENELTLRLVSPEFDEMLAAAEAEASAATPVEGKVGGAVSSFEAARITLTPAALNASETAPSFMLDRPEMSSPTQVIPPPPTHSPPTPPDNVKVDALAPVRDEVVLPPAAKPITSSVGLAPHQIIMPPTDEEPGYVFIRGFGSKISHIKRVLDAVAGTYKDVHPLPLTLDPAGAAVVVFGSDEEAEVASQSLHSMTIGPDETLAAFMVWEARGEPGPKDIIEDVFGTKVNLTAVIGKTPVARPRDLQRWDATAGAPDTSGSIEDAGPAGEWDQFAANERLGVRGASFDDDLYTTKLDTSNLTADQRARAEAIARAMGESNRDSTLRPDGEGDGDDEEARHSAVLRKPTGPTDIASRHLLISGLSSELCTPDVLKDFCSSYEGGAEAVHVLPDAALGEAAREKLKKLDREVKLCAGLLQFAKPSGAASMLSDLHGQMYDDETGAKICLTRVYPEHEKDADAIFACDGKKYVLNAPPLKTRKLQKWTAGEDLGELGDGTIGEWDQFEANRRLGVAESTYNEELYTTVLRPVGEDKRREAARLAAEIGESNKDSTLCADGEGDGDDEEARHSSVNPVAKKQQPAPAPAPPAAPATPDAQTNFIFIRGIADMSEEETAEVLEVFGCPSVNVFILDRCRHPVGAAIVEVARADVRAALELDNFELSEGTTLASRIVFPPRVFDPEALIEELPNGVLLDLTLADERR